MDIWTTITSSIIMIVQGGLFVFGGAIGGIIFWKKRLYGFAYAGFGHFIGVVIALLVTMWFAREDGSLGILIIFTYPLFTFISILIGALWGRRRQKQLHRVESEGTLSARIDI